VEGTAIGIDLAGSPKTPTCLAVATVTDSEVKRPWPHISAHEW